MSHPRDQQIEADFALLVTSDSRKLEDDHTGSLAVTMLEESGHNVVRRDIVPNDPEKIKQWLTEAIMGEAQVIITSGGTGIGPRDKTVDAVSALLERRIEGFGELFRRLSYEEVGDAAIISRATAGVARGKLVFCLPGSRGAMELGLRRIVLPGLGHMLWELSRR